ncbi:MAG: alpha/beta fold hydrolase [Pseudomonadota bacterium]
MQKALSRVAVLFALFLNVCVSANAAKYDYLLPYVKPSSFISATLSPDGEHIAVIGSSGYATALMIFDTASLKFRVIRVGQPTELRLMSYNKDPLAVRWVTNHLMAVDFGLQAETLDLNGKTVAAIGQTVIGKAERNFPESEMVLVFTITEDRNFALVNGRTGAMTKFRLPMDGKPVHWAFDQKGELRAVTMMNSAFWKDATTLENWYLTGDTHEWKKLAVFKITDEYWRPARVTRVPGKDEDNLIVFAHHGHDRMGVYRYDLQKRELGDVVAAHPSDDIVAASDLDQLDLKSVWTGGMIPKRFWFESKWAKLQASVDMAIPSAINILSGNENKLVLVFSYSDRDPGRWYLLDTATLQMREILAQNAWIDPEAMRPMQTVTYQARDGMKVPAYLTEPKGRKVPGPAVVLIHGGPVSRDQWGWSPDVQLLAAQGYAVLQPQFRGSSGFGRKFEQAGYGQWGLAMQDDVAAGVQYLIDQGIADPKRICIVGASYGGYAALWGLVKTPDLFRCGVSVAGVVDIETLLKSSSEATRNKAARELMRSRIGDLSLNKQQFDLVSPLKQVERISAPVLLVHGTEDQRVPIEHSKKMRDALRKLNKPHEWLELEGEGHSIRHLSNQNLYYEKLLKFLDKNIGEPEKAMGLPPPPTALSVAPSSRSWLNKSLAPASDKTAWTAFNEKKWPAAIELWNEILIETPDSVSALTGRGWVYSAMEDHGRAISDYQRAVHLEPGNNDTWGSLCWGNILANRPLAARPACEKALSLNSTGRSEHLNLGHTFLLNGEYDTARKWYAKSIDLIEDEQGLKYGVDDFAEFIKKGWMTDRSKEAASWYAEKGKSHLARRKAAE